MPATTAHAPPLRRALLLDAAASGALGLLLAIGAGALAAPFGLPIALLRGVGLFLVPFAASLVWLATRERPPLALVWAVVIGNVLWTAASVWLAVDAPLRPTALGTAVLLAQGGAVALFAWLEYAALRRGAALTARGAA